MFRMLVAASVLACSALHANAEETDPRIVDFLRSKEMRTAIAKGVHQQVQSQPVACKDIKLKSDSKFKLLSPFEFSGDAKKPTKGAWIETLTVDSCGVERRHNIQSIVADGKVQMIGKLNGTTISNLLLQRDAVKIAETAARQKVGGPCDKSTVLDTEFKSLEGEPIANAKDGPKSRVWKETWTVWTCGKEVLLPLTFTPDATGTAIAADATGATVK